MAKTDKGIVLPPFSYLYCSRNPLPRTSDAIYVVRFKGETSDTVSYFSVVNLGQVLELVGHTLIFFNRKFDMPVRPAEWNIFVFRSHVDGTADVFFDGRPVLTIHASREWADRYHRYEGLQLGFFNDKYNNFGAKYYPRQHAVLNRSREFGSLAVYNRLLTDREIRDIAERGTVPGGFLAAYWEFVGEADQNGNYLDRVQGLPMHLKRVRSWE